jgi:Fur family ferric uptake transcriptional regulator
MTDQRRAILETLDGVRTHPTADEVYAMVRKELPRISLGTVYRNLEFLSDAGALLRLDGCGSQMRFDGNVNDHDHVRCTQCGRVDDVPGTPVALKKAHPSVNGYEITGHRLEYLGYCRSCKRGNKRKKR